tara:strand:- start:1 stop:1239 length:1239 start_codon:yes stop_codon:yes gene_type:complete
MATHKFNSTWIAKLPYSSKREVYIDSNKNTQFANCDFLLVVGAKTKTAYLRHRPQINGKTKEVWKKIGDAVVMDLKVLTNEYTKMVMAIKTNESPLLSAKKIRNVTLGHLIDFYLSENNPTDIANLLRFKKQKVNNHQNVSDLVCLEQDVFTIKDILKPDVAKGSLYVANQKREFIQRVWNYAHDENREYNQVLKTTTNPAAFSMKKWCNFSKKASTVHLPKEEYVEFFKAIDSIPRSDFRDLLYMFLFTGQHPYSEVAQMRWDQLKEVEGQMWWIMEEGFHKTGSMHSFPLHPMAMDIINKYKDSDEVYVFKNVHSLKHGLHNKDTFKNILRGLRKTHGITWDIRCLRASFITCISQLMPTYRPGVLTNQAGQTITERHYMRGDITYYDFKVDMINEYMNLIQDKLNEVSK